jgi:hypothetical protein
MSGGCKAVQECNKATPPVHCLNTAVFRWRDIKETFTVSSKMQNYKGTVIIRFEINHQYSLAYFSVTDRYSDLDMYLRGDEIWRGKKGWKQRHLQPTASLQNILPTNVLV